MASKKTTKKGSSPEELDFDDLDGLEGGMDFSGEFDDGPEREPSKSQVAKTLAKDAGSGFIEGLVKKAAEDSLPSQYSASYHDAMDVYQFTKEVVDVNKEKLNKSTYRLGKEVKKLLPFKLSALDKYLEAQESNYEQIKQQSEEDIRNQAIASELTGIFDKQLETQKALHAKSEAEAEVDRKQSIIQGKLTTDILASIDSSTSTQTAFTLEVGKHYYRKSLELQFKSYFVQADMLRTMRDHYKAFSIQFTNIEKNTSLPEFVKLRNTERLQEILRTQATQNVYNQMFENSKFLAGVKKRVSGFVEQKVSDVTESIDNITDMLGNISSAGEMTGGSSMGLISSIMSGMLGSTLGERVADKISPKIKDKLKDNKAINTGANYLNMLSNSPSTLLQSLRTKAAKAETEYSDESSPGRWITSKIAGIGGSLLDVASPIKANTSVDQLGYLDHSQPAIFDQNVHRHITEVVPLYLSRLLKQSTDLTSMYYQANKDVVTHPNTGLLVYDFGARKLTDSGSLAKNVETSIFGRKNTQDRSKSVSKSILSDASRTLSNSDASKLDKFTGSRTLNSKESESLLTDYIERAKNTTNIKLSYETLVTKYDTYPELTQIVDSDPKLKTLLSSLQGLKGQYSTVSDATLSDLRNVYPIEGVKNLFLEASKLAKVKKPHMLTDQMAQTVAKSFTTYIMLTGRDIDIASVLNMSALTYMKTEEFDDKLKNHISVFIDNVKRIVNLNETFLTTSLEVLFGLANKSLKTGIDIDPEVYRNLNALYPDMVKKGQLSVEQLVEGRMVQHDPSSYVSLKDISEVTRISRVKLEEARTEITYDGIFDTAAKYSLNRVKAAADALKATHGNPVALAELIIDKAGEFKTSVTAELRNTEDKVSMWLKKANLSFTKELSGRMLTKTLQTIANNANNAAAAIDKRIVLLQRDLEERRQELAKVSTEIRTMGLPEAEHKKINRMTRAYEAYTESEIKALIKMKTTLNEGTSRLLELRERALSEFKDNPDELNAIYIKLRGEFSKMASDIREAVTELEKKGRDYSVIA